MSRPQCREVRHPKGTAAVSGVVGHIAADKLETLCFSPLLFKVCSAVHLPKTLRGVPNQEHNAETYGRTDRSEQKAIICMLDVHICVCSFVCTGCGSNDWTKPRVASPTEQSLSRFSSFTFLGWIKSYRNSSSVPFGSTRDLSTLALMGAK